VGYSTAQVASKETIHPSKRRKLSAAPAVEPASTSYDFNSSDSITESEDSTCEEEESVFMTTKKYNKSKVATNLVTSTRVSTNKAAKICQQLSHDGIDIPTPSQAAIYKSTYKEASKLKEEMIQTLQMEQWSLHFDGKRIEDQEYQVVVLKNERTEIKLGALH